ncbi:hypothetical protein DFH05DRAFT_1461458 [Lentinula detonsa]|uniref:Hemerythrin-like domain-containing protein n=1 Tax=Lentinula detonsa TaxID=2804962 RepID=A0A9W8NWR4_9AGAR|nr:hypothetical protein DFH05DRAFT_1461458 [Lentinula detonsa]
MPAPYPLITMLNPSTNSYASSNMAAAHNAFIQGINAIVQHAPTVPKEKVQAFMIFGLAVVDNIHHHHDLEEQYLFPEYEKKLGHGAMSQNVQEHKQFVPALLELKEHMEDIKSGNSLYDSNLLLSKIHSFSDVMIAHLTHEVSLLESGRMRANFTEKDLKDIDSGFMSLALKRIEFATTMPLSVVCGNPETPWFPPFPLPLKWATRWWFARKYSEAWEFGPLDLYGNPRK